MAPILNLESNDEDKELEFELDYQLSLTTQQRFEMMFEKSQFLAQLLLDYGHRKPFEIIKRTWSLLCNYRRFFLSSSWL